MKSNFDNKNYILTTTEPIKLISSPIISNRNMNPLHPVGYLGSAILTKGKTGLGSLQQPLKELYSMYVQKSGCKAQQRLLIISTEGLTFQWNDSGVEKFINNSLSSVYDVQLLKIVSEKRKDKKFYCAFLPLGEETDPRYSNLFLQLDKQHQRAFESSSSETCHPSIIALIMRRSQGIQALECHVLITRSGCEANQIVNCIRSACSKYKFNVTQQTDVFQYKPYTVDNNNNNNNNINFENHVDLITGLNTSSNAVSLMGHKEKLKKTEVNLGIKNNQSLLSKLKANLKENNFMHKNKDVVGMPPLPARKNISSNIKLPSSNEDTTTTTTNKKSILCSASARDITARVENDESKKAKSNSVRIVTEKADNSKKQKSKISACSAVSFDEEKSGDSKKLASSSTTSINKQEKKLSLGKRLLLSARSSIKGSKLSNSSTTISKNEKSLNNYDYIHKNVSDIDFRRTSKNKTNDARLVDANMMYPFVQQPVRTISTLNVINNDIQQQQQNRFIPPKYVNPKIGQNFILKSRSSASPIIVQRQHVSQQTTNNNSPSSIGYEKKLATSYQSTPSLVVVTTENHNNNLQQKQQQQQQRFISRSPSTTSINNNNNNNNKFQNRTTSVNSVPIGRESRRPTPIMGTNYHAQYVRNCSSHAASQSDINNIITTRTKLKSPLEDPKLMSTHLVWNKNSKSAENLDSNHIITTEIHSTSNNNNVRAVSPISSINSIYTTTTTNQNLSASRENLNQNEQNVIAYKNSTKIRDSPMIQKGPLNKTVIVVRNDDYFIQPETISTTTTTTTTTQLGNKQQQQNDTITTENYNSLRKSSNRLDLVEEQERCISNASMKSFTSSGIKLVPAYTYEMNEAAIQRRNRLREIEENLYKDSPVSFHQMCHQTPTERSSEYYHFNQDTEYSDNDHEVIDLTKQARLNEFTANKSVDLPIEIYFTNQQNNNNNNVSSRIINMEPFENDFNHHQISRAHSNYENNQTTSNRSVHQNSTSSTQQQQQQYFSELDNNKQINYVYYYGSNEDFGGY